MNINFNKLIRQSLPLVYILLFTYILSTIAFVLLPKSGVDFIEKNKQTLEYKKYDGFYSDVKVQIQKTIKTSIKNESKSLSEYILKGIYSTSSNSGWIIIENKRSKENNILSQFDDIDDYVLTKLYKNYVVFEKENKEFTLNISNQDDVKYEMSREIDGIKEDIIVDESGVKIKRDYLNSYVKDIDKVWNNIAINEIRENDKITGFEVTSVNTKSVFGKLGLQKGDIIKSINNNILASYADAFKVYNNINNTKYLNIEILRNNEIMELNYEID